MRGRIPRPWRRASDGNWWVTLGGKQINLGKTKAGAHTEMARLLAMRGRGPAVTGRISVADLIGFWSEHAAKSIKPDTIRNYRRYADDFVSFVGGLDASDLKPWHITQWIARHQWTSSTQHLAISVIKMATAWGDDQGLLDGDPIRRAKRPKMTRRKPITLDDAIKVVEAAGNRPEFKDALRLLLVTGVRPGELCSLDVERIDLDARSCVVNGKRGERTVFFGDEAEAILRRLCGNRKEGPLFLNLQRHRLKTDALQYWFKKVRRKMGLGDHVTPHTFRGLFSTEALRKGVDSALVSQLLGHADPTILLKHYATIDADMMREAIDKASG